MLEFTEAESIAVFFHSTQRACMTEYLSQTRKLRIVLHHSRKQGTVLLYSLLQLLCTVQDSSFTADPSRPADTI